MKKVFIYGVTPSGNTQKALLACQFMNVPYELRNVSFDAEAEGVKNPTYLRLHARGLVPVLIDPNAACESASKHGLDGDLQSKEGLVLSDSAGILPYLALTYNPKWYPVNEPIKIARINAWMAYSSNEIHNSLLKVRVSHRFGWNIDPLTYDQAIEASKKVLAHMNDTLSIYSKNGQKWLVEGEDPTIADIHVFPYVAFVEHSSENAIQLNDYPEIAAWVARFKKIPNYVELPGV